MKKPLHRTTPKHILNSTRLGSANRAFSRSGYVGRSIKKKAKYRKARLDDKDVFE